MYHTCQSYFVILNYNVNLLIVFSCSDRKKHSERQLLKTLGNFRINFLYFTITGTELEKEAVPLGGYQLARIWIAEAKGLAACSESTIIKLEPLSRAITELFHVQQDFLEVPLLPRAEQRQFMLLV